MKRIMMGAAMLALACSLAVGQVSLLNEATNGLFKNVNDFVIKPNVMFNTVETKQVIVGGGFNDLSFKSNTNGGGLIGYYHPGETIHWSIATSLDMKSTKHNVEQVVETNGTTTSTTEFKNPVFNNYAGGLRFNLGLPETMNLSAGLIAYFEGQSENQAEITQNGATTFTPQIKKLNVILGFPLGIAFTPEMYNFFEPYVFISNDSEIDETGNSEQNTLTELVV